MSWRATSSGTPSCAMIATNSSRSRCLLIVGSPRGCRAGGRGRSLLGPRQRRHMLVVIVLGGLAALEVVGLDAAGAEPAEAAIASRLEDRRLVLTLIPL